MDLMLQALSVFILYVRCTAIDPADPGILIRSDGGSFYKLQSKVYFLVLCLICLCEKH